MKLKLELLKTAVKRKLMQLCGVERMVKDAFIEGYSMHGDTDWQRWGEFDQRKELSVAAVNEIIQNTRCWRSVDEAWVNSDAQEYFE